MLFTWDTTNLCIVFRRWRITSTWSLLLSILAVMAITVGYEAVRDASRRYERRYGSVSNDKFPSAPDAEDERRSLLPPRTGDTAQNRMMGDGGRRVRVTKAALYGIQVFYSFFIMLLFMTYNGWIMLAVGVGAFLGYLVFPGSSIEKSAACH
ncbi:MAG: hypothetical protein FE78DRAFT_30819 [Acidomyces sp. 'richmondensis']|nr:MAG: hypothetical protein FE78DRAFT_30819 [Acidomyces sp. 'richmondensis']